MTYEKDAEGRLNPPPIHGWMGLSYSSYFVVPRLALQDLPHDWQRRFISLMDEAYEKHGMATPAYHVLREGRDYTLVSKYDDTDETSRDYEFTAIGTDPWANYRRGNAAQLMAEEAGK